MQGLAFPNDEVVHLCPYNGIGGVDRDSDELDAQFLQPIHRCRQHQTVGAQAQGEIRELLPHHFKSFERFLIGQRIPGTCDPNDAQIWYSLLDVAYLFHRLLSGQEFARHAGPRFVRAIVLSIAIITLDVASWSNGQMHPCELSMGFLRIARMSIQHRFEALGHLVFHKLATSLEGGLLNTIDILYDVSGLPFSRGLRKI